MDPEALVTDTPGAVPSPGTGQGRAPAERPERPGRPGRPGHAGRPDPRRRRRRSSRKKVAYLYLAPAVLAYSAFVILPWLHSVWISFYDWDGIGASRWIGLANYREVFTEPALTASMVHALGFIAFYTVLPIVIGLVLAATVAARKRRGLAVVRTVLFLPQILPLVAVGVVWSWIYGADGPLNQLLRAIGLGGMTRAWLGDFTWAYPAVGMVGTWVCTGLCFILLLAGIQKIDGSLYEAARMDGAGRIREFFAVTLPSLRKEIIVAADVTVIAALASFDVVYVMTGGGPGSSTTVPGVQVYELTFTANRVGTACALATVLSVAVCAVVLVLNRLAKERP
ncbi:raffinose/stachyose/melibiose transport system permease protein [Catenulispora sp. MAP5-51]|uniref:carbohydrate ABC transporter permease n=1 Tax=Catenulispora sp. MAP5-51 TaxID=3156298 RepID=UPI0035142ABE